MTHDELKAAQRMRAPTKKEIDEVCRQAIAKPRRVTAPIQYYGGKGVLAPWIVPALPPAKVYVEPYCGAASLFWHLPRPYAVEVLNDLDGEIINLFRCLQDPTLFEELRHRITWTPYSLAEFRRALEVDETADPLTRAWATFVKFNQSLSGVCKTEGNWSRTFTARRGMAMTARRWRCRMYLLPIWHDRLTRVQLDSREAFDVIRYWDSPETVFYLDPPYAGDTRKKPKTYRCEATDAHLRELVDLLLAIEGQAVLSGYQSPLFTPLERAGWRRIDRRTSCFAANRNRGTKLRGTGSATENVPRIESLWVHEYRGPLFGTEEEPSKGGIP